MGKQIEPAFKQVTIDHGLRTIKAKPVSKVDPNHPAFHQLAEDLQRLGYTFEIDQYGNSKVDMPKSDFYTPILKKIAWAYFLAIYPYTNPPLQQTLPQEVQ